jgi:coenzyme F420-reducing hydrogenase delta subunit
MLAQRRFSLLKNALEHIGLEPERLHFAWVGASQADKFVRLVTDAVESARALGPAKVLVKAKV